MKLLHILGRGKFGPIHLIPGDKLQLTFKDENDTTKILYEKELLAEQCMVLDEGILFEGEFEDRRCLGGMALEQEIKS